jgi:CheY-like chemotaxis protein
LVDDVDINREIAQQLLEGSGLLIDTAADGQQAVDMARATDYALILMDLQMPVMDGLQASRTIHTLPGRSATPILAMTANAFDEDRRACLAAGMVDFIFKPVDPDILYRTLLKWLPASTSQSESKLLTPEVPVPVLDSPRATDAPDSSAASAQLPGLDAERGLRTWRQAEVYAKFLRKFALDYASSARAIAQAVAAGEAPAAAALAHKLKGAAANLALPDVAHHAGMIDQQLKAGTDVTRTLTRLQHALDTALDSIAIYAPCEPDSTDQIANLSVQQATQVTPLLTALLHSLDADNPDQAEPLLTELATLLPAQQLQLVRETLNDFDFRGAEAATRQLAERLDISIET